MSTFQDKLNDARRLFLLQVLVEGGGSVGELILRDSCRAGFHRHGITRELIRADLSWLDERGCVRREWLGDGELLVAEITERGEDAARGDVQIAGIKRPPIAAG